MWAGGRDPCQGASMKLVRLAAVALPLLITRCHVEAADISPQLKESGVAAGAQMNPNLDYLESAPARTFHLSTSGNDAAAGSVQQPWRTLAKSVAKLRAG